MEDNRRARKQLLDALGRATADPALVAGLRRQYLELVREEMRYRLCAGAEEQASRAAAARYHRKPSPSPAPPRTFRETLL